LYEKVIQTGGIISEYPPGIQPLPHQFPARNRIISALSDCVVVIEAKEKSGSLITADFALEDGRDVFFHRACFLENAQKVSAIVKNQLESDFKDGKASKYKKENTVEKYLEAGAPIIESYEDYCAACKEVPGQRHIKQLQGTLFDN
jgi:DNA processing protein